MNKTKSFLENESDYLSTYNYLYKNGGGTLDLSNCQWIERGYAVGVKSIMITPVVYSALVTCKYLYKDNIIGFWLNQNDLWEVDVVEVVNRIDVARKLAKEKKQKCFANLNAIYGNDKREKIIEV